MNVTTRWKFIFALLPGAFCLNSCGSESIGYGEVHGEIYESVSPAKLGSALFREDTGRDTIMTMYVRDNAMGAKAIELGNFGIAGERPLDAVWSKDGTVVAVKERVQLPTELYDCGVLFTYVYDFLKHASGTSLIKWERNETIYTVGHLDFSGKPSCQKARQYSNSVKALLLSRGGVGQKVLINWDDFNTMSRPVKSSDNLR